MSDEIEELEKLAVQLQDNPTEAATTILALKKEAVGLNDELQQAKRDINALVSQLSQAEARLKILDNQCEEEAVTNSGLRLDIITAEARGIERAAMRLDECGWDHSASLVRALKPESTPNKAID